MLRLTVPAMTCGGCAANIRQALKDLPGVGSVQADPLSRLLTVEGGVDPSEVRDALVRAGYGAGVEPAPAA